MSELNSTHLQDEMDRWIRDFRENVEPVPGNRLYHYTTVGALCGILRDNYFRMTDYRYLNDPSAFKYSLDLVDMCLTRHSGDLSPDVMKALRSMLSLDRSSSLLSEVGPYILSFSEESDSLYEWRAYADDGNGVCIGIEPPPEGARYRRNLARVHYDAIRQNAALEQRIQQFLAICSRHPKDTLHRERKAWYLYRAIMDLRCNFKHPAYSEESEWRYTNFAGDIGTEVIERAGRLVPCFPARQITGEGKLLPITEIRLGPRQDELTGRHSVLLALKQHGYDVDKVEVSKTEIPYGRRC